MSEKQYTIAYTLKNPKQGEPLYIPKKDLVK